MTLTLHGLPISNYYNKVKMALLEKGVPFAEAHAATHSTDEAVLRASPLAKIPFVTTPEGALCESQVIVDWIEVRWPQPPLLPADAFAAAKVRELTTFLDWHLEMAARQLYGPAFFGAPPLSEANGARVRRQLEASIAAFQRIARFAPYVAGEHFTQADLAAFNHLPLVGMASKAAYGQDLLLAAGVDYKAYLQRVGERPSAQKVVADRKAAQQAAR
ncbi:glutathione S-transferase [Ramlibacter tataouinensis]|uniref:Glutathione S-transferases-like protein n=1 Tax=Ramlibacter tataouinensis (strain ATCC BAA-407 / DSM 14655 / LMG 21543 / TTB310) TaxID=365046 RepID=F5Y6A9_RAMTT|nr:glutathione S-transferase [Ramlibacter tataouinensis]AEG92795.1 glutathione S-transferases-like protein [Ramlibacter tataouinensis TTB310]